MKFIFIILPLFLLLVGCGSMKEKIGLLHHTPNEFETTKNPPLEVPKKLSVKHPDHLKPKRKETPAERAQAILKIGKPKPTKVCDPSEENLLKKIKAQKRDTKIREKVDTKTKQETFHDKIQSTLVFWKKPKKGTVIDPHEEKKKLQKET